MAHGRWLMADGCTAMSLEPLAISHEYRSRVLDPRLFPRRARRTARAGPQTVERGLIRRKRFEQIEQDVGELARVREQESVVAVADALGEARAVVERADRHAGAEQIRDLHRDVETGGRPVQAQPEVRAADDARVVFRLDPARAQLDAACRQAREATLELGAPLTVAADENHQIRKPSSRPRGFPSANAFLEPADGFDRQIEILVFRPTRRADDEADVGSVDPEAREQRLAKQFPLAAVHRREC